MAPIPASLLQLFAPLAAWMSDPAVRRILVDGAGQVFVERAAGVERVMADYPAHLLRTGLDGLARRAGKPFDANRPCLEAMLKDGTRFLALCEPVVEGPPVLAISRPVESAATLGELVAEGTLHAAARRALEAGLAAGLNVAVVGPPTTARDRLVGAMVAALPLTERLAMLESGPEADRAVGSVIRLSAHKAQGGGRSISGGDLLYAAGRLGVDRIVVGDVRLGDAWDAVSLLASRGAPVLVVLAGATAEDGVARLEALARASATRQRERAVPGLLASGLDLVATLVAQRGGRGSRVELHVVRAGAEGPQCVPLTSLRGGRVEATPELDAWTSRWIAPEEAPVARLPAVEQPVERPRPVTPLPAPAVERLLTPPPVEAAPPLLVPDVPAAAEPAPAPPEPAEERTVEGVSPALVTASVASIDSIDISVELPGATQALAAIEDADDDGDVTAARDIPAGLASLPGESAQSVETQLTAAVPRSLPPAPAAPTRPPEPPPADPLRRLLQNLGEDLDDSSADYDEDDEEVTMVTDAAKAVGEDGELLSRKTFSQILRSLGAPEDSVESVDSDWPDPPRSREQAVPVGPAQRRERHTVVTHEDD